MSAEQAGNFGMVIFGAVVAALIGNQAQAAGWDAPAAQIADAGASGAYQEFDLGSTTFAATAQASNSSAAGIVGTAAGVGGGGTASASTYGTAAGASTAAAGHHIQVASVPRVAHAAPRSSGSQRVSLAPATTAILDRTFGRLRFLPPTSMESFVRNSAGAADLIYGDEGTDGPPPFEGFDESHRINTGIYTPGLTTGHRSFLPEAWGYPN